LCIQFKQDKALHPKIVEDKVDIKIARISLDVLLAVNECKMYSTSLQMRFSSTTFLPWDL